MGAVCCGIQNSNRKSALAWIRPKSQPHAFKGKPACFCRKRQGLFEELSRCNAPYSQAYLVTKGHAESLNRKDSLVPAFRERRKLILGNGWYIFWPGDLDVERCENKAKGHICQLGPLGKGIKPYLSKKVFIKEARQLKYSHCSLMNRCVQASFKKRSE